MRTTVPFTMGSCTVRTKLANVPNKLIEREAFSATLESFIVILVV